ncbi:hypothetical protein [Bdellovibrio sp. HCB337]|uniref:hypothetical protein n=1 Tax=Bdellovibrio sp. HCB337 TaxID=3394358 RepID=UPI0039A70F3B
MSKKLFLVLSTFFIFTSGCALKELHVDTNKTQPLRSLSGKTGFTKVTGALTIGEIRDHRPEQKVIGQAKTGMFNTVTPIYLDIPAKDYVGEKLKRGLTARGLKVDGKNKYVLNGFIKKLTLGEFADGWSPEYAECYLSLDFNIYSSSTNQLTYSGTVEASVNGTNSAIDSTDSIGPALDTCMEYAVEKILNQDTLINAIGIKRDASSIVGTQ